MPVHVSISRAPICMRSSHRLRTDLSKHGQSSRSIAQLKKRKPGKAFSLPHDYPTIDIDRLASDIRRLGCTEVCNEFPDLLVRARTFQRHHLIDDRLPGVSPSKIIHARGVDDAWTDGVHPDVM